MECLCFRILFHCLFSSVCDLFCWLYSANNSDSHVTSPFRPFGGTKVFIFTESLFALTCHCELYRNPTNTGNTLNLQCTAHTKQSPADFSAVTSNTRPCSKFNSKSFIGRVQLAYCVCPFYVSVSHYEQHGLSTQLFLYYSVNQVVFNEF